MYGIYPFQFVMITYEHKEENFVFMFELVLN